MCFRTIIPLDNPVFMATCKILSWNIREGRNLDKRLNNSKHIKTLKPTICLLQETHVLETDLNIWASKIILILAPHEARDSLFINKDITF